MLVAFIRIGELAQLVERLHGMQEVSGSTPLFSTYYKKKAPHVAPFLLPVNDFIEQQFQHPGLHTLQVSVLLED